MRRCILFVFVFIFFSIYCFSQNVTIKGVITDTGDNMPIDNVNISVKNTNKGCVSKKDGSFEIKEVSLPLVLQISHLAYQNQIISLAKEDIKRRSTIELNIQLSSKTIGLEGVIINANPVYQLERLIYDFEIDDNNLYLICNKKDKKFLQVYTFDDYLKDRILIPQECNELQYDYSNTLSIKQKEDEGYYILLHNKKGEIKLKKKNYDAIERGILITIEDAKNFSLEGLSVKSYIIEGKGPLFINTYILKGSSKNKFFYQYDWYRNRIVLFKLYEEKGGLKYSQLYYALYSVGDWLKDEKINYNINYKLKPRFNNKYDSISMIINDNIRCLAYNKSIIKLNNLVSGLMEGIYTGRLEKYYRERKQGIPINIKQIGKNVYIFNFEKKAIYKLSETGFPIDEIKIDDNVVNDYGKIIDIITNQEQTRCFMIYSGFNNTELKEIDLTTGKYLMTIPILTPLVEKIRIVGNAIYYITRTDGVNGDERCLFKQKLD